LAVGNAAAHHREGELAVEAGRPEVLRIYLGIGRLEPPDALVVRADDDRAVFLHQDGRATGMCARA
jgi:hypothetical protein